MPNLLDDALEDFPKSEIWRLQTDGWQSRMGPENFRPAYYAGMDKSLDYLKQFDTTTKITPDLINGIYESAYQSENPEVATQGYCTSENAFPLWLPNSNLDHAATASLEGIDGLLETCKQAAIHYQRSNKCELTFMPADANTPPLISDESHLYVYVEKNKCELFLMEQPNQDKDFLTSDNTHLYLYKEGGCNLFLMSTPIDDKDCKTSDKNHLYLYQDGTDYFYYLENDGNRIKKTLNTKNLSVNQQRLLLIGFAKSVQPHLVKKGFSFPSAAILKDARDQGHQQDVENFFYYIENEDKRIKQSIFATPLVIEKELVRLKFDQSANQPKPVTNDSTRDLVFANTKNQNFMQDIGKCSYYYIAQNTEKQILPRESNDVLILSITYRRRHTLNYKNPQTTLRMSNVSHQKPIYLNFNPGQIEDIEALKKDIIQYTQCASAIIGIEAQRDTEDKCDLLLMPFSPDKDKLHSLPLLSNAAYIRTGNQLFYINKKKNVCTQIICDIYRFDEEFYPNTNARILSEDELTTITDAFTGHIHTSQDLRSVDVISSDNNMIDIIEFVQNDIDQYYKEIAAAEMTDYPFVEKINAINKFIQKLLVSHYFPDANGRTFVFLLANLLLLQNGLGMKFTENPCHYAAYSLDQLKQEAILDIQRFNEYKITKAKDFIKNKGIAELTTQQAIEKTKSDLINLLSQNPLIALAQINELFVRINNNNIAVPKNYIPSTSKWDSPSTWSFTLFVDPAGDAHQNTLNLLKDIYIVKLHELIIRENSISEDKQIGCNSLINEIQYTHSEHGKFDDAATILKSMLSRHEICHQDVCRLAIDHEIVQLNQSKVAVKSVKIY